MPCNVMVTARGRAAALLVGFGGLCVLAGCSSTDYVVLSGPRDWKAHPAVVERDTVPTLYALSDIHGSYDRMRDLLAGNGLIQPSSNASETLWTGGATTLVVVGDLIDKGTKALQAIEALRALQADAPRSGGEVIVMVGNHEAEFFVDPWNHKAESGSGGIDVELAAENLTPLDLATGADPRGAWLRTLPFAARVGDWFFCHSGDTHGRSVRALESAFEAALDANDYDDDEFVGSDSILVSTGWFDASGIGRDYAQAVGAEHIVFGHDPTAIGDTGVMAQTQSGAVTRIDCGMSTLVDYSTGRLLRVRREGGEDIAESLDPSAHATPVWRGPVPP